MSGRRISGWLLPMALLLVSFIGCNLFNPSGEGGDEDADADGLIAEGEECMRDQDFVCAYDAFSAALAEDSSKSLAWHGLIKATVGRDSLPITELIRRALDLGDMKADSAMPFLNENDSVKNRFYRPLLRLQFLITKFKKRDSLGRTDGVFRASREDNDLLVVSNLGLILKLADLNRDTIIDSRDNLLKGAFDSLKTGGIKPSVISADSFLVSSSGEPDTTGKVDSQKVSDFNTFIQGMSEDVETNRTILKEAVATAGTTTTDTGEESIDAKIDKFLDAAGGSLVFWKLNDFADNDGDGCVDEEIWGDSVDNDGDGLVDEDARASYIFPGLFWTPTPASYGVTFARAPEDGIYNDRVSIEGKLFSDVKSMPGTDDANGFFQWADIGGLLKGRTKLFQDMKWIKVDTTATFRDIQNQYPTETLEELMSRARNKIRLDLLNDSTLTPQSRKDKGIATIGGCWSKAVIK